jgi:hypothetical protein
VPLYPLGRSERLRIRRPQFMAKLFRGQIPQAAETLSANQLLHVVGAGGCPDAIKRRGE